MSTVTIIQQQLQEQYGLQLKFGTGKKVFTKNGERFVYSANPCEAFWGVWREFKEAIKLMGLSVSKVNEDFVVNYWAEIPDSIKQEQEKFIALSRQDTLDDDFTKNLKCPENLSYLNYQKVGIKYAIEKRSCLIADEMGLGKTIQAIGVINNDPVIRRVIIVCPASIKKNWENELNKWLVKPMSIKILNGKSTPEDYNSDIIIINYDVISKQIDNIRQKSYDLLICDESQYVKNYKSKRTKSLQKIAKSCGKRLLLTGTPILNRPNEILSQLLIIGSNAMSNFNNNSLKFLQRYCSSQDTNGYQGSDNIEELNRILRANCMILRKKNDVLKDLPKKFRKIIKLEAKDIVRAEQEALKKHQDAIEAYKKALKELKKSEKDSRDEYENQALDLRAIKPSDIAEITRLRHSTAIAKIPYVIDYINNFLESTDRKIVVFAHHKDVIQAIYSTFASVSVKIDGSTDTTIRQSIVEKFQTDDRCRIFIGSLHAASTGITLTAASDVLFAEIDWTPATLSQAEDRCHRIGQENCVSVQHLVFDGSIDGMLIEKIIDKQKIIDELTS